MGVSCSASFHQVGSWRPTNSSEQSMSTGPMTTPSTPTQLGAAVVWVRDRARRERPWRGLHGARLGGEPAATQVIPRRYVLPVGALA
jgi:hypothetical protein